MLIAGLLWVCQASDLASAADTLRIEREDVTIERDTRVTSIAACLADAAGDGALRITRPGVTVDFGGAELRGAQSGLAADRFQGIGIVIEAENVTLRGARVSGYAVGILARGAHGLVLEDCDVSGNFRQRLGSSASAEDPADWLSPHANDLQEWRTHYGAGICIEDSRNVTVRRCRARRGQNGLILDRVRDSTIYDNDFSFLSGWGIALWRSSRNRITRNALDFCIRGYSHGVYNRGQDSAGLLLFEQCNGNHVLENSITHGGDGVFGFAGKEAMGETESALGLALERRGCNDNLFADNDLSFAAAHGLELTFSFGNRVLGNRFEGNAICGIWGGYSQDMRISGNEFIANGDAGYGSERGGVNIEHGRGNRILGNRFERNACGVRLWWDADVALLQTPWALANGGDCADNTIARNRFEGDLLALQFTHCSTTRVYENELVGVGRELDADADSLPRAEARSDPNLTASAEPIQPGEPIGESRPVGARASLRGREKILVDEWGPYDWESPHLARAVGHGSEDAWRWLGPEPMEELRVEGSVILTVVEGEIRVAPSAPDAIQPYALVATSASGELRREGVVSSARWRVRMFAWSQDPREDARAWRREAQSAPAFEVKELSFAYGMGGPGQLPELPADAQVAQLPRDGFGTLAETSVHLAAGRWRLDVTSDDGVRVLKDGVLLLEDWTHHAPRKASCEFEVVEPGSVQLEVEHFELDGYAILELVLERVR